MSVDDSEVRAHRPHILHTILLSEREWSWMTTRKWAILNVDGSAAIEHWYQCREGEEIEEWTQDPEAGTELSATEIDRLYRFLKRER